MADAGHWPDRAKDLARLSSKALPVSSSPCPTPAASSSGAAETLFGHARDEVVGCSIFDLIVPADRVEDTRGFIAETLATGGATYESR
jgi:hypothetical protein